VVARGLPAIALWDIPDLCFYDSAPIAQARGNLELRDEQLDHRGEFY